MARKKAIDANITKKPKVSDLDPEMYDMKDKETAKVVDTLTKEPEGQSEVPIPEWIRICRLQAMDSTGAMNTVELQQETLTKTIRTVPV